MSFESILTYVGRFGRYQIFIFCVIGIHGFIGALVNVGIVFIAPQLDHWCFVPQLGKFNLSESKYRTIIAPKDEQCKRYDVNFTEVTSIDLDDWNDTIAKMEPALIPCDRGWTYDRSMFSYTATEQVSDVIRVYMTSLFVTSL